MIFTLDLSDDKRIYDIQKLFSDVYKQKDELKNACISNPYTKVLIYEIDNEIVAILHFDHIIDRVEIININVLPGFRKRHIAISLMDELLKFCQDNKISNITLEVRKDNKAAINLYEKYHFKIVSVRKKYYNGIDGFLMEKEMM